MPFNPLTVAISTAPTFFTTFLDYILDRSSNAYGLSYAQGIALIRRFLEHASHHTVEELQLFTARELPVSSWVCTSIETIGTPYLERAAAAVEAALGTDGIEKVGGRRWWRWRERTLTAEWVWVRPQQQRRWWSPAKGEKGAESDEMDEQLPKPQRTLLYVHGGAYYFGSVNEHRYQLQRHARNLDAKVFAARYRLAPQFPFPCALYDVFACYLHLLSQQPASTIMFAGDSAGGGLLLSLLCLLRDQQLPLPAGTVLISPWVDLCHSFPSVVADHSQDYVQPHGFLHRPSAAWPPPPPAKGLDGQYPERERARVLRVLIEGTAVEVTGQIQLYTTNDLLPHPLVSPVNQRTLAGLCPLLVLVGGGELLRDEQVYIAHKAAFPETFDESEAGSLAPQYAPTKVHLQLFLHACHVLPTLSWTRPAKAMGAAIAAFADKVYDNPAEIPHFVYDHVSPFPSPTNSRPTSPQTTPSSSPSPSIYAIPGAPQVPLTPASFPPRRSIGVVTSEPVRRWLEAQKLWDTKYPPAPMPAVPYKKVWEDEFPPPSAAILRRCGRGVGEGAWKAGGERVVAARGEVVLKKWRGGGGLWAWKVSSTQEVVTEKARRNSM